MASRAAGVANRGTSAARGFDGTFWRTGGFGPGGRGTFSCLAFGGRSDVGGTGPLGAGSTAAGGAGVANFGTSASGGFGGIFWCTGGFGPGAQWTFSGPAFGGTSAGIGPFGAGSTPMPAMFEKMAFCLRCFLMQSNPARNDRYSLV